MLTGLSVFWFDRTGDIVPNHLISYTDGVPDEVRGRALAVRKLEMLPVECVVRGYITGSGWKDYQATGSVSGIELPAGLQESEQLPGADLHARARRRRSGHDETIDFDQAAELVGDRGADGARARRVDRALHGRGRARARARRDPRRHEVRVRAATPTASSSLGDEVLTPDSSRYWPADDYERRPRPAELRQAVRARLGLAAAAGTRRRRRRRSPTTSSRGTRARYVEAYERITGEPFAVLARAGGRREGAAS